MYDRINVASKTKKILDSAFDEPISVEDGNYLMNLKGSEIYPLFHKHLPCTLWILCFR